jgi:microsomal epoxide hydrolase
MSKRYTPETLPYHFIVPSLVGYTLSSGPPLTKDWLGEDTARIMHKLLLSLGFKQYGVQGGDIGSRVSRIMGKTYDECKSVHLNAEVIAKQDDVSDSEVTPEEWQGLERSQKWLSSGTAYAIEHGTRSSTISLVLSSSPLALLAW